MVRTDEVTFAACNAPCSQRRINDLMGLLSGAQGAQTASAGSMASRMGGGGGGDGEGDAAGDVSFDDEGGGGESGGGGGGGVEVGEGTSFGDDDGISLSSVGVGLAFGGSEAMENRLVSLRLLRAAGMETSWPIVCACRRVPA